MKGRLGERRLGEVNFTSLSAYFPQKKGEVLMPHRTIIPLAIGLLAYKLLRSYVSGLFSSFGFPFAA